MGKKGTREKSPEKSASPPPLPTKARAKRAAATAAVAEPEAAHSSGLDLSPKKEKKEKKDKKEKKEKREKKEKKEKKEKEEMEEEGEEIKDEEVTYEDVFYDDEDVYSETAQEEIRDTITINPVYGSGGTLSSWRLPGALSPYVDSNASALREAVLFAVASGTLSRAARYGMTQYAIWTPSFMESTGWDTLLRTSAVQSYWALAASIAARTEHVVGWNDVYALSALNVLISAPMVYLLSMFYNVPLSASLLSESLDVASDILPALVYKKWIWPSTSGTKDSLAPIYDPIVRALIVIFSAISYTCMAVQACIFYLPEALILHFAGISTVEPARLSQNSTYLTLLQNHGITAFSTVCAVAAWVYIVECLDNPVGTQGPAVMKPVIMRSLAASTAVGLGVFVRCLTGVYGVDATGAVLYDIVWTLTPLILGSVIGYIAAV